jgi:hypothetical protein
MKALAPNTVGRGFDFEGVDVAAPISRGLVSFLDLAGG